MRSITVKRVLYGKDIEARIFITEDGIQVLLTGGDKPHIGACCIVDPTGRKTLVCFEGHREEVVVEKWAMTFHEKIKAPVVISAGIHFDNISKEQIREILNTTDAMLIEAERQVYSHICRVQKSTNC